MLKRQGKSQKAKPKTRARLRSQANEETAEHINMLPGFAQTGNGVTNAPAYDGQVMGINGNGNAGGQWPR